jgi:hypothetical protein
VDELPSDGKETGGLRRILTDLVRTVPETRARVLIILWILATASSMLGFDTLTSYGSAAGFFILYASSELVSSFAAWRKESDATEAHYRKRKKNLGKPPPS